MDKKLLAKIEELIVRAITYSDFSNGRTLVATGGTPVRMSEISIPCAGVYIQSLTTNTGIVYWGRNEHRARAAIGIELDLGAGIWVPIDDVNKLWLDVAVNGEGVCWAAMV